MDEDENPFPSVLQAALLMLALFLLRAVVGAALYDARDALGLTEPQCWALETILSNGLMFATVMHALKLTFHELFHPARTSIRGTALALVPRVLLLVPAMVLAVAVVEVVVTRAFPLSEGERALFERMAGNDLATLIVTCLVAPAVEEMFFRGIVLRGFLRRYTRAQAIWGSAALFGLAHLNLYQFVAATLIGALSGWLYTRSRSLVPCIALHASYNTALAVLAALLPADAAAATLPGILWLASVPLAAVGVWLLRRQFDRQDDSARQA